MSSTRYWIPGVLVLAGWIGVASGCASAAFLVILKLATDFHTDHPWMLYGLPLAGVVTAWLYNGYGRIAARGNNLLLDQIHAADDVNRVPLRMLPLVLIATVLTHLFGGSAGREGTAVQMGGAIAGGFARTLGLSSAHLKVMLMCGISGGFSGVFGTPMAGTVFSMEVVAIGSMRYDALIPCLISALLADLTVRSLGVHHGIYTVTSGFPEISIRLVCLVAIAAIAFGLASLLFAEATAFIEHHAKSLIGNPVLRAAVGGLAVVFVTLLLGTSIYNGLSLPLLSDCFSGGPVPTFAFLAKLLLTALTLGVGFKGGEVTPLFVIGATLGVTLAGPLGLPPDMLAALGFVAVFAAAANTPIACVVMGAELFGVGGSSIILFGVVVFIAYTISGHHGIYHSQKILVSKHLHPTHPLVGYSLHEARSHRARQIRARRVVLGMQKQRKDQ
ncbi:MAG: chloride channel protein [Thermomicrobiales bacterium]|nr:chloride channel protein [Thermomicrobiales bacterium]MCO5226711.1 chloride channel protein [Thermomicrobiales bacterium]